MYFMYQKYAACRANPKHNKRDEIIKCVQDSYEMCGKAKNDIDFPKRRSAKEEKAEQLKENIMESLKLND